MLDLSFPSVGIGFPVRGLAAHRRVALALLRRVDRRADLDGAVAFSGLSVVKAGPITTLSPLNAVWGLWSCWEPVLRTLRQSLGFRAG
jgi:hypothetical protein